MGRGTDRESDSALSHQADGACCRKQAPHPMPVLGWYRLSTQAVSSRNDDAGSSRNDDAGSILRRISWLVEGPVVLLFWALLYH
jgi:hypothetical protein